MTAEQKILDAIEQQTQLMMEAFEQLAELLNRPKLLLRDDKGNVIGAMPRALTEDEIADKRHMVQLKHEAKARLLARKIELLADAQARLKDRL